MNEWIGGLGKKSLRRERFKKGEVSEDWGVGGVLVPVGMRENYIDGKKGRVKENGCYKTVTTSL